jgi:phage terminase large subunit-like protein
MFALSNVYPRKARPEQKIDAAVALIMAIAQGMAEKPPVSIYESRGLILYHPACDLTRT